MRATTLQERLGPLTPYNTETANLGQLRAQPRKAGSCGCQIFRRRRQCQQLWLGNGRDALHGKAAITQPQLMAWERYQMMSPRHLRSPQRRTRSLRCEQLHQGDCSNAKQCHNQPGAVDGSWRPAMRTLV